MKKIWNFKQDNKNANVELIEVYNMSSYIMKI
jgi:hypothetical protein